MGLVFILYLAQSTSVLWLWHIYTDTYHHPESESRQNEDSKKGDNNDCPVCNQLKTLGANSDDSQPGFFWSDISCEEIFTPQFLCLSELNKWLSHGRSPPPY